MIVLEGIAGVLGREDVRQREEQEQSTPEKA